MKSKSKDFLKPKSGPGRTLGIVSVLQPHAVVKRCGAVSSSYAVNPVLRDNKCT